ncbi:hypothetical protein WKW58_20615 [Vibrio alginolyticus]|uniref:hypothetical protein n=1 Tax=Vibrio alginolyticus TaxID=663 RepID=UPI003754B134
MLQYQIVLVIAPKMNIGAVLNQLSRAKFNAEHAVQYEWDKHRSCIDSVAFPFSRPLVSVMQLCFEKVFLSTEAGTLWGINVLEMAAYRCERCHFSMNLYFSPRPHTI